MKTRRNVFRSDAPDRRCNPALAVKTDQPAVRKLREYPVRAEQRDAIARGALSYGHESFTRTAEAPGSQAARDTFEYAAYSLRELHVRIRAFR